MVSEADFRALQDRVQMIEQANLPDRFGTLEGTIEALRVDNRRVHDLLVSKRDTYTKTTSENLSHFHQECDKLRKQMSELGREVAELRSSWDMELLATRQLVEEEAIKTNDRADARFELFTKMLNELVASNRETLRAEVVESVNQEMYSAWEEDHNHRAFSASTLQSQVMELESLKERLVGWAGTRSHGRDPKVHSPA